MARTNKPVLCHGSEAWTIRTGGNKQVTACKMKFVRRTASYKKWGDKRNKDILTELRKRQQ
jgi:hypothetical protein